VPPLLWDETRNGRASWAHEGELHVRLGIGLAVSIGNRNALNIAQWRPDGSAQRQDLGGIADNVKAVTIAVATNAHRAHTGVIVEELTHRAIEGICCYVVGDTHPGTPFRAQTKRAITGNVREL
jgi:hypothetical protein